MAHKLEGMESELAVLEKDVQRHEERQEKEEKVHVPMYPSAKGFVLIWVLSRMSLVFV